MTLKLNFQRFKEVIRIKSKNRPLLFYIFLVSHLSSFLRISLSLSLAGVHGLLLERLSPRSGYPISSILCFFSTDGFLFLILCRLLRCRGRARAGIVPGGRIPRRQRGISGSAPGHRTFVIYSLRSTLLVFLILRETSFSWVSILAGTRCLCLIAAAWYLEEGVGYELLLS